MKFFRVDCRTRKLQSGCASPRALVIRDGKGKPVAGREVVRQDLIVLPEGDRVPADAFVIDAVNLTVDEFLLTGESVPVRKVSGDPSKDFPRPGGDDVPGVFSGTLVVRGYGPGLVTATGARTEIGKLGRALRASRFRTRISSAKPAQSSVCSTRVRSVSRHWFSEMLR
jgi:magnesium-transporting ATPase (P-type)